MGTIEDDTKRAAAAAEEARFKAAVAAEAARMLQEEAAAAEAQATAALHAKKAEQYAKDREPAITLPAKEWQLLLGKAYTKGADEVAIETKAAAEAMEALRAEMVGLKAQDAKLQARGVAAKREMLIAKKAVEASVAGERMPADALKQLMAAMYVSVKDKVDPSEVYDGATMLRTIKEALRAAATESGYM